MADGVRALRIRVQSGRDRRTLVFTDLLAYAGFFVGNELQDDCGEMWKITNIASTTVIARIPFRQGGRMSGL